MSLGALLQLCSACIGFVGSLFLTKGVIRQSNMAMIRLSSTYWSYNSHLLSALAAQKVDYIFGGGILVVSFLLQYFSFYASSDLVFRAETVRTVLLIAGMGTIFASFLLCWVARFIVTRYVSQLIDWQKRKATSK